MQSTAHASFKGSKQRPRTVAENAELVSNIRKSHFHLGDPNDRGMKVSEF
jgi:hypothetical protein